MKRFIASAVIIGALALAVAFFLLHRSFTVAPVAPAANSFAAKTIQPQSLATSTAQTKPPVSAPATSSAAELQTSADLTAIANFSQWAQSFTNSSASLIEGERLAWKRREAMAELIQSDPKRAIELSVPFALRQSLPPQITKFFERQVDGRGDFLVAVATDFSSGNTATDRRVQVGGTNYQAFVYGRRRGQISQTAVPLHGIALDGKMAVSAEPLRKLSFAEAAARDKKLLKPDVICSVSGQSVASRGQPVYADTGSGIFCFCGTDHYDFVNQQWALAQSGAGGPSVAGSGSPPSEAWTHGIKNVLYMRVNFPDDLTEPISEASAYAAMNSVNTFYTTSSYDQTALDSTVTPLITLLQTKAYYSADPGLLLADARAAAKLAGFDTANYDRDIVAFTTVPNYTFGGLAYVGGKGIWLQSMGAGVTAHEMGHNYGLWHANFWDMTATESMIGPGTNLEYGNIYDTMGLANAGIYQFNAAHKNRLDWLNADAVQVISTNGVYRIYPFDSSAQSRVNGRFYAAAVQKDFLRYYWLEFRKLFTGNSWTQNGVLLNWSPWDESNGGTQLIDTTPGSPTFSGNSRDDAALVVGRTFNDQVGGVHITTLARGSAGSEPWLDVQVNAGAFPGNRPPAMTMEVDNTNVAPGMLVHFHATATDADGDTLAYAWSFDDLTFSTNNLPWISKFFAMPGEHVVRCVVSDMKGGEASANAVVTVGTPGGFRISGRVTDTNGFPLEGVLVSNGSNSVANFFGGWTDSDGRYVIVNVNNVTLNAVKFGYNFSGTANWSNPLSPASDTSGIDFTGAPLPTVNVAADTNAIVESDGSAHYFTVTRTGDISGDLTVPLFVSGTATLGTDYTLSPAILNNVTIPAGTNNVTFTFHALNDGLVEGPETATLTLLDDVNYISPGYALAPYAAATITILDDDSPSQPSVTVATSTPLISEDGVDSGVFIFTRSGPPVGDLLVNYSVSGTAQSGTDYALLAGVVLIPAGQNSATVFLQPLDDHAVESNETVVVSITASGAYSVGSPSAATVTIQDDGANVVTVFPNTQPAAEPSTPGAFTIKRDGDLTDALVVGYTVGGTAVPGVDYSPLSGTVTIPAGVTSANVTFTPLQDGLLAPPDKYVTLILTNDFNYDIGTPGSASIFITQSERATVSIATTPTNSVSEQGDTIAQFRISRTTTSGDLTVYLALSGTATPGGDYLPLDNPVVIPDGSSSVTLDVIPFHDLILEPTESVILTVQANTNYNVGVLNTARMNILDDATSQIPGVGFCFATSSVVEGQSPGIAVTLSTTSSVPVYVGYKVIGGTAPGARYSLPQGTLTIPKGDFVAFVPLQIIADAVVEPPQTVKVVLFNPTNATLDSIKTHTYTILDDDLVSVSVTATAASATEIGPVPGNFRIARTGSTNASQLVNFQITGTASAPADYAPLGTSAMILAGATYVDLPVVPANDHTPEISETVVLTLISATNGAIVSPNKATVVISDNDTNPLPVVAVTSTNQPCAIEGGTNGAFLFTRIGATNSPLAISFTVSGTAVAGVRYTAITNSVIIPAGQYSTTLPVAAIDDNVVEGEQTVIVSLIQSETYRSAFPSSATVTVQDNDQRAWMDASDFKASKYGPDPGQFTFSRFGTTNTPATIYYAISGTASNGVDYVRITNFIVIPAGQLTTTLPIAPLHTGIVKGPATATLTLLSNAAYFLGIPTNGTVTIDDDMPTLTISALVTNVLEGSGSNGVFRVTRTGDPQFDFTAHIALGGVATFGVDYPPVNTNIFFTCGITSIDLLITPTNEIVIEGDESVTATLLPNPAYSILSPSNAVLTIADAGTNQTPVVIITSPKSYVAFLNGTNAGLILNARVIDAIPTNDTVTWTEVSGPPNCVFGNANSTNTTVLFASSGIYLLRLTADNGFLQGHADVLVFVSGDVLSATNILHWTLDEGAGTNAADSSGYGRNGIFSGQPSWITNGAVAGALQFFGTNDCVRQSAGSNTLNGLNAFTVAMWVKPPAISDRGFLTGDDSSTNATFSLATKVFASCGNSTNIVEATLPATGGALRRTSASSALKPGQWQHVALTWTNGQAPKLFFNGQLDQPLAGFASASGVLTNCPQFIIGKGALGSPASWNGALDDVRVFNAALSAAEILALADDAVTNHAPVVNAGTNVTVQLSVAVTLVGAVTDDGLPNPPGTFTNFWTYLGTNNIIIPNPSSLTNTFVFTDPGTYVFRLTAFDGELTSFADVTVTVIPPTQVDIAASVSDANELGPAPGEFTLTRNGDTNEMTVYLTIAGTASNAVDYATLTNVVTFAASSNSIALPVTPFLDYAIEGDEAVIVTIITNAAYSIGNGQATVTIHDSPYGLWSIQHFTLEQLTQPQISGPSADFDHDSIVNFAEYAFNLDPAASNSPPPYAWSFETSTNDNRLHLTLTYTRRLPPRDVEYGVFVSTNLPVWNTGTNYVQEFFRTNDPNNITETVKTRALLPYPSATNLFMNIRVWLQQVPALP